MRKLCTWLPRNEPNLGFLRHSPVAGRSSSQSGGSGGGDGGGENSGSKEGSKMTGSSSLLCSEVPTTMTPLGILDLLWEETDEPMFTTT